MNVIEVKNVTKTYKLYKKPSDVLYEMIFRDNRHRLKNALYRVNFSVKKGESFGVVGSNGSGKSTILSMINGTTFPSSGEVCTIGSVSLLNVGAGIVQGYTGHENIYYKCGLMGLTKSQVNEIYDEIVEFSEIGEYLSQPVNKYSSGMKSKLGFAISIHIMPDILIIDEALAVGDSRFQKKCHAKLDELKEKGLTLLYVSHSHGAVKSICDRAVWIECGEVVCQGSAEEVSKAYESYMSKKQTIMEVKKDILHGKFKVI